MSLDVKESKAVSMKKIVHPGLAKRLESACDGNPDVPPLNHGRLGWFVEQLEDRDIQVTVETVRKWFAGETRPRPAPTTALAQILKVDELWLTNGTLPEFNEVQRKRHNAVAGGVVNLVAGFIQIDGGHPAFPADDDSEAKAKNVDLYAIIRGAKYNFHIAPVLGEGADRHFIVPHEAKETVVLGVVPEGFRVRIFELDWETVMEKCERKSAGYHVPLEGIILREITSFAERI
jgi:hypothetical protein